MKKAVVPRCEFHVLQEQKTSWPFACIDNQQLRVKNELQSDQELDSDEFGSDQAKQQANHAEDCGHRNKNGDGFVRFQVGCVSQSGVGAFHGELDFLRVFQVPRLTVIEDYSGIQSFDGKSIIELQSETV